MSTLLTVLTALAFGPHPPLLVPELARGASRDLDELRVACSEAVRRLVANGPELLCVVGGAERTQWYHESATGSLAHYGSPVLITLGSGSTGRGDALNAAREPDIELENEPDIELENQSGSQGVTSELPLSVTIGAWLLAGCSLPRVGVGVAAEADDAQCRSIAARAVADPATRVGLLVMGDGSARRSERSPGYLDPRAAEFDRTVARALATGDAAGLAGLDPVRGVELLAAGVPAWRVAGRAAAGSPVAAELLYDAAPYGVGYLVASWLVGR